MPVQAVSTIIARIRKAPQQRPISVFVVKVKGARKLDAIYGNTIESKRRQTALKPYHPSDKCPTCGHITTHLAEEWLGDFHQGMNMASVHEFLTKALEN